MKKKKISPGEEKAGMYKLLFVDEDKKELKEIDANDVTSMLIYKDKAQREYQLKKASAMLEREYGGKLSVFQYALKRAATELNPEEMRIFLIMMAICDYENWIRVRQPEIAAELGTVVQSVSRGLKGLCEKKFIEKLKQGSTLYYRINPKLAWKGKYENWKDELKIVDINRKSKKDKENQEAIEKFNRKQEGEDNDE